MLGFFPGWGEGEACCALHFVTVSILYTTVVELSSCDSVDDTFLHRGAFRVSSRWRLS